MGLSDNSSQWTNTEKGKTGDICHVSALIFRGHQLVFKANQEIRGGKKGKIKHKKSSISSSNYQMKPVLNGHLQRAQTPLCAFAFSLGLVQLPADNLIILTDKTNLFWVIAAFLRRPCSPGPALRIVRITEWAVKTQLVGGTCVLKQNNKTTKQNTHFFFSCSLSFLSHPTFPCCPVSACPLWIHKQQIQNWFIFPLKSNI